MTQRLEKYAFELGRRELLELLGASVALAGLGACTQSPREKILPYAQRVADVRPGVPTQYATSMVIDGFAMGLLAKSNDGRPTKLEGNPSHPASLGATGVYEQASVLELYSPGRKSSVQHDGALASWDDALAALQAAPGWRPWFIMPPQSSPLLASLIRRVRERHPASRFSFASGVPRQRVYEATSLVFGRALEPHFDFGRAQLILSLGADFLSAMPMSVRWAREFASTRRPVTPDASISRLYVLEPAMSITGAAADNRLALRPSALATVAGAILRELMAAPRGQRLPASLIEPLPNAEDLPQRDFIRAVARELDGARGRSIVIAGDQAALEVHVLAHALNSVLGNLGQTAWLAAPALIEPEGGSTLLELAAAVDQRAVDAVIILDDNPVYWAPPALELGRRLRQVRQSFHLTYFENETSHACRWVMPLSHYLESWGDARSADGTISFVQPLIEPLHASRSVVEVLAACAGDTTARGHTLLTDYWKSELGASFEPDFDEHLRRGLILDSAFERLTPEARWGQASERLRASWADQYAGLELHFETSPALYDGRFAGNAWLLELPDPITKQTWGNAALLSPNLAGALGVSTGRVVEIAVADQKVEAPALIVPGQSDDVITLSFGYGQTGEGLVGRGLGVNAYLLRENQQSFARNVAVRATNREERLAITQNEAHTRGRPLAPVATLAEYREHPELTAHLRGPTPTVLPLYQPAEGPQWAMTIDTSICTGCSACVVACQAENNVPVVGKREVERGREMHWLRVDRYISGTDDEPRVVNQPMLCQHCETAPCEYVCPVNATVHSPDGLNEMVYNRCIGTRFCSNNCPYKVRRFNWFEFTGLPTTEQLARNPDVTVRERGVMEKCTYCVQRIRRAEMDARMDGHRSIQANEVVTACQQACPTGAIQFGSLEHTETAMVRWRQEGRAYAVLHDVGTRPRTQYLAKIINPNPEIEG